ncbi:hypothetical protein [Erythrobacter tepidarius]|uniref:hypothetical protein n=1 Tax=Erythrobacter tepidarius TaxID=60454 RepID=UPI001181319C|nr:hypothetical protein [Erythrobacter tepidarius]
MNRAAFHAVLLLLLCTACTGEAGAPAERGGKAAGEVLGGSISDAMIPLEQLDSQAPLAPRQGPAPADLDAEQPVVTPVEGVEGAAPQSEGAEAPPAAPAPDASE